MASLTKDERIEAEEERDWRLDAVAARQPQQPGLQKTLDELEVEAWKGNPYAAYIATINRDGELTGCIDLRAYEARHVADPINQIAPAILAQCRSAGYFDEQSTPRLDDAVAAVLRYRACASSRHR